MNPAPSVVIFTVLSGLGFGFLALLGVFGSAGMAAFFLWALGYGLAVAGLVASTFHLGNPQRALLAFTQWRTSWLSREAWASVVTLLLFAPQAVSDWLGLEWGRGFGMAGAAMAFVTVYCTSMIYAQIRAVPRWHHWTVPAVFLAYALSGALVMGAVRPYAAWMLVLLGIALALHWHFGKSAFARAGASMESATGLGRIGAVSVFEQPHTGGNYLMREMIFVVGRKHADRVRMIAMVCSVMLPVLALMFIPGVAAVIVAVAVHLLGALAQRWLFFAEAEHVVGLYYGAH
ncbi:dibenzothiophene desulfurase [Tabrizicola sp. TH137]|uniref:dimethyl sulfoxide reductase anchor subunit family protein n=1 Tax=Tabrizicola sp. TH137 TaxID=2067452 RepID=UPI000C7B67DA|nr:DmsC/YnfH family molybdoenzyme membrane anchor subunit [Tabrizicola sp. TH137]PLL12313.1 dibenzothiophene desulfurase [Tabrizicola sp. TH137]